MCPFCYLCRNSRNSVALILHFSNYKKNYKYMNISIYCLVTELIYFYNQPKGEKFTIC